MASIGKPKRVHEVEPFTEPATAPASPAPSEPETVPEQPAKPSVPVPA